jgi:branched-chain amino acid transport system permease protein
VAFRLRGGYFAIGTWVIAEVFYLLVLNNTFLGAGDGRTIRSAGVYDRFTREDYTFYIALAVGFGAVAVVVLVLRSRLGLALRAIRDNEAGARGAGIDVTRAKLITWVLASGWTGLTGGLIYVNRLNVQPDAAFSVQWTAFMIVIVVIGGVGSTTGPIIGTVVFWVLRDQLADFGEWYLILLGTVAIAFALLAPKGIYGLLNRIRPLQFFPVRRRLEPGRSAQGSI